MTARSAVDARPNTSEDGLPTPQRYWAILTLMTGLAMSCLDTAIVNVALPGIARDLRIDPGDSIWIVNAYQLAVMVSLLSFASLGDIFGYRRVYRAGLVVYTIAALISATAGSLEMLAFGRALQGLGAAGLMSVNTALVRYTYPRRQLGRGIAMVALVVSVSSAAGPSVAAAILALGRWPWLFAVNVPIGVVTFLLSLRLLPHTPPSRHRFDLWSAGLCAAMFGALISGINGLGHHQALPYVAAEFAGALASGYVLVQRQLTQALPLLPVDLFCRPVFALSVTTSVCSFVAQGIAFVALPFYFHDGLGASAVTTGLMMTPWAAMTAVMAPISGRLADRYPAGVLGGLGLSVLAVGFVLLAVMPAAATMTEIMLRVGLCGIGFGLFQSPNNRAIIASAPRERSGGAGAIQGTARLLGQSIGAALVALVFGAAGGTQGASAAILLAAGFAVAGVAASLTRLFDTVRAASRAPTGYTHAGAVRAPIAAREPAE